MQDDLTQAVLSREDVARYLRGGDGETGSQARERIYAYLDELRTTQRYPIYKALGRSLYPILRKIERLSEGAEHVREATRHGRVCYISNHRSHLDYLVEPLVLEDNHIRPPVIAAGINLFGGPLGMLYRHVTGAIPIRRNTKDPAYLVTLKAYVSEVLRRHDLLFYPEGGRSYSGEMKTLKTGLLHACMQAGISDLTFVPTAISYDLVLEDRILSRQGVKRTQRPFSRELAEMVGSAVGYRTRAFVSFGEPLTLDGWDPHSRRDVLEFAHVIRERIGLLYRVLPTVLVASAMRPSATRRDIEGRVQNTLDVLAARGANLREITSAREAVEKGVELLILRSVIVPESQRYRVRDRTLLRYYARAIQHLLTPARRAGTRPH